VRRDLARRQPGRWHADHMDHWMRRSQHVASEGLLPWATPVGPKRPYVPAATTRQTKAHRPLSERRAAHRLLVSVADAVHGETTEPAGIQCVRADSVRSDGQPASDAQLRKSAVAAIQAGVGRARSGLLSGPRSQVPRSSPSPVYSLVILVKGLVMRTVCEWKSTVTAAASTCMTRPIP
jgi:hypothetical protein